MAHTAHFFLLMPCTCRGERPAMADLEGKQGCQYRLCILLMQTVTSAVATDSMDGNLSEQCTVTSQPSLLMFGHGQSLAQTRSRLDSWQACLGGLEAREVTGSCCQQLSVLVHETLPVSLALPGSGSQVLWVVFAAAQVSGAGNMPTGRPWGGRWHLGSCECVLLEGPGHFFYQPISLGQQVTILQSVTPARGSSCCPSSAATRQHGHGERVELPHLP